MKKPAWIIIAAKEVKDILRDFRSVCISLILPLFLFPALFYALQDYDIKELDSGAVYTVMTEKDGMIPDVFMHNKQLRFVVRKDISYQEALRTGYADVYYHDAYLYYDNADRNSLAAATWFQALSAAPQPVSKALVLAPLFPPEKAAGRLFLSLLLPFMCIIFASTCPLPIAADLSAGEKERGSLEPLITTSVSRTSLAAGKLLAVSLVGFLSVCAFFAGVIISLFLNPSVLGSGAMQMQLASEYYILLFLIALLLTVFYSALELALGVFTRSSREAQLLGMPLLIVSMAAVYVASSMDLRQLPFAALHIPLVNAALVIRELAAARPVPQHVLIVCLWLCIYAAIAAAAAAFLFKREKLLFRS